MKRRVAFDFWEVSVPGNGGSFFEFLSAAETIGNLARRTKKVGTRVIRFETLENGERLFTGDVIKLRMDELPGIAGVNKPRTDLDIRHDEGIAEDTAFAFDPRTNILITQRNFFGVSGPVLVEYFRLLAGYDHPVECNPVINDAGDRRLEGLRVIRKLVFKISRPKRNAQAVQAEARNASVGKAIEIIDDLSAKQVEVVIGVGRRKGQLDRRSTLEAIKDLLSLYKRGDDKIEKIVVAGLDEDMERDSFDLLEYRIRSFQDVTVDPARRNMTASARRNALIRAFREKVELLEGRVAARDEA